MFYRLIKCGSTQYKSEKRRRTEHERRLKAKRLSKNKYRLERKRRKRPMRQGALKPGTFAAAIGFAFVTVIGIVLLPIGIFDFAFKCVKAEKKRKQVNAESEKSHISFESNSVKKSFSGASESNDTAVPHGNLQIAPLNGLSDEASDVLEKGIRPPDDSEKAEENSFKKTDNVHTRDEKIPKSKPKSEKDRYIRRRMIIAGSSYCNKQILDMLTVGTCLDVIAEPENPYDKNAIRLMYLTERVGYISKSETLPLLTCMELNKKLYAVITDIISCQEQTKYEFEVWIVN